ncbi:MAG: hypothetical protein J6A61_05820 [Clostridia bacterium]|nr:hypothetical protein [Clostridia bacterium]MBO5408893.1 hypothetical protein [Clostridia bacterium]
MMILKNGKYVADAEEQTIEEIVIPYDEKVVSLIRQKYSIDEELAIQRQRDTKPEEFNEYFVYCEECKLKAREE